MKIEDLDTPVLLVDADAFERNVARMAELCADAGVACRPHAKAHKSPQVARIQMDAGAVGMCCAKLGEAEVMAAAGIEDLHITTPVVGASKIVRLIEAARQSRVSVVADDADNISDLAAGGLTELQPGSYIFMDTNYSAIGWEGAPGPPFENALTVLAGVLSRPASDRVILDSGMKAISGDGGAPRAVEHADAEFRFAGDEHGQLTFPGEAPLGVGDKVTLLPSHCDTTVNLHDRFIVTRGGEVEDVWDIAARGRSQ